MADLCDSKELLGLVLVTALLLSLTGPIMSSALANPADTIETELFRWIHFPLNVLVDMNQWSTVNYSIAVREALNSWLHSIWNFTNKYGSKYGGIPPNLDFRFFLSNKNFTSDYDVLISFAADELGSNVVGVTHTYWDNATHLPDPPIIINITTYHDTTYDLFVKNVAMHEFGHALGLGHASSQFSSDGPELMYPRSVKNQVTYPSTLDVYALARLYQGDYGNLQVELPSDVSYVMLTDGSIPPPSYLMWETLFQDLVIVAILLIAVAIALTVWRTTRKREEPPAPPMPPSVESPQNPNGALSAL